MTMSYDTKDDNTPNIEEASKAVDLDNLLDKALTKSRGKRGDQLKS